MFGVDKYKPVKLRNIVETKKYGVAAKDLKELLKKGCKLLQKPINGSRVCTYDDGTEVTDGYFKTLPDNVELVLLSKDESLSGFASDIARLLSTDRTLNPLLKAAKDLISGEQSPKRRQLLCNILLHLEDSSEKETREEDESWFDGIDARFKTKSAYMKFNCECRIRGYLKELEAVAKSIQKPRARSEFTGATTGLKAILKSDKYNGCYFQRMEKKNRMCSPEGWFTCQGAFDEEVCQSLHSINPYGNRESRIIFSTWNLDHRIEKKRAVIPALLEAVQNRKSRDINLKYFYDLLFTRANLKLVHIVCHKKGPHHLLCDRRKIYKRAPEADKSAVQSKQKSPRIS